MNGKTYLKLLGLEQLFGTKRTKEILSVNPTVIPIREEAKEVRVFVYDYDAETVSEQESHNVEDCLKFRDSNRMSWINIDGLRKADVEQVCQHFQIHQLLVEDILSVNQRPKMDEVEGVMFCLLNMLYYNDVKKTVESEQISIVLGHNFVISFQEDASRDVFNPLRTKLKMPKSQIRSRSADYLCYSMIDLIVDNYFLVMEKLGDQIEQLEEELVRRSNSRLLIRINQLRKELIVLKRNIAPVRDLVSAIIRSESELLDDNTTKYFKDVYDHIVQAFDLSENYRDVMMSMQDLYINNVNLKLNEVMKVMAIVTCLLAPATVIGGIFGMNFDIIPYAHHQWGFYFAVAAMFLIPLYMLWWFRKKGWF
ncbi:MAG: magnesium/cobalt transporter CorA [Chitinophagaceae bacterium]|jgi:magnesium transporter|nr:magnesium/cobalt transporter CorA [Chitinophagaceae bacterium]